MLKACIIRSIVLKIDVILNVRLALRHMMPIVLEYVSFIGLCVFVLKSTSFVRRW